MRKTLICAMVFALGSGAQAQVHDPAHAPDSGGHALHSWGVGASAIPLLTHVSPAMQGRSRTEGYLTQPMLMAHAGLFGGRLELTGTLNLEGLTLRRGELNAGIWGEGYVDRRHPHTYLHELAGTIWLTRRGGDAASLTAGRGFVPFGTDDPMSRPAVKFPANHHLAQILERLFVSVAVRRGAITLEGAIFNGDEPTRPEDMGSLDRFADSWSTRLTTRGPFGLEAQASYASVRSPEHLPASGLSHRMWSASARFASDHGNAEQGEARYLLVEWARTDEYSAGRRLYGFDTFLAEGSVERQGWQLLGRLERTARPEEERLENPFRTPRPHMDVHMLGLTRWTTVTLGGRAPAVVLGSLRVEPFVEVSRSHVRETLDSPVFDVNRLYGSDRLWSFSAGSRIMLGATHPRMGRYGAATEPGSAHAH